MEKHILYVDDDINHEYPIDVNVSAKAKKLLDKTRRYHAQYLQSQEALFAEIDKHNSGREWEVGSEAYTFDVDVKESEDFAYWASLVVC